MHPVKKITKEDTWRSDDLKVHIQAHKEESKRRSKREEEHRKYRDGESLDRRHRDPDREARREKEKLRERESTRERSKHSDPDRDRNQDIKKEDIRDDRYKERKRERERENRHRDGDEEEKRYHRGEKENSERRRDSEKDSYKDRDIDGYNQGDYGTNREREKDRDRRRAERDRERKSETDRRKEERREGEKEERERDKERERERKTERDRRKEGRREGEKEERERVKERDRERREKHRARESEQNRHEFEEKQRDGERRERHSDKEQSGHKEHRRDRDDREKRRRDKESHVANTSHSREVEQHHQEWQESKNYFHGIKDEDREKAREKEERDRQREKRHKEASDSKRSDRDRKHKDSSGHDLNARLNKDKEVENEETEEDKDYHNDYEEDFEDYEEDFEDGGEEEDDDNEEEEENKEHDKKVREDKKELSPKRREEIEAIQRAIDEENERIYSARSKPATTELAVTQREKHSDRSRTHGKIIDFVSAKQREISQKVAKKQKKRSEELLRLIDLDFSITFSLLDLPPVNEYDMYIKNFGTANTKQACVQCNEDNTDRDTQTEEVDLTDKWTQHPPEANAACGGSRVSQDTTDKSTSRIPADSQHLTTFIRSAAQVMAVLIEENMAESNSIRRLRSQTDSLSFSDGCIQLNTKLPFLYGRQVSLLQFSHVQRQTLLSVHPASSKSSAVRLDGETIICVWNIWEPSRPQKILLYESEVRCCCFSPGKVTLVFAGTEVGSVVVWDLREHSGTHLNLVVGKEVWTLRYPTFSTDAVLSGVGHLSPVVSIEPVLLTADTSSKSTLTADIDESLGLSFQLGSLDENGLLTLWVVVELPKGNDSGSQTDLGLRPGGKIKLLHSSSLQTTEKPSQDVIMGFGPPLSLQLKFLPSDSNHYFIGTNMGLVRHCTRHSLKVLPKFYRSQFDSCRPVEVTALDFSPSGEPLFLVGCSDGTTRLHSVMREDPLMEWSGCSSGASILSVQWSQTRPAVFCVLDAASDLHIWDLTVKDYVPVVTENIHNDRVTAMAVFGEPAKQNAFSGIALAKQSGKMNHGNVNPRILTHGLCHVLHLSCEDTVSHMTCGEGAAGFASLHSSGHVQFYYPDGRPRDPSFCQSLAIRYIGLTSTHLPGRLVGWGPGAVLTILDAELNPLVHAVEPMDVRVCKILEHSNELVTAGMGNVCVWCLTHLVCRKRVVKGLGRQAVFTHLALMTGKTEQGLRALAAYGRAVVVVDLTEGCIIEHKKNLHLREITGMVYCPLRDIVVTASDMTIRVWGPDWELQMAFVGHTALVTSLVLCPVSGLLLSSSLDGTLRCWRPEVGDQVQTISIPNVCPPPLIMGGPDSAGTFFSYSTNSVDFWTFNCLYNLHCRLDGVLKGPVRQILTPPTPPSFRACVVCIHGNSDVTVVEAETGEVLTRLQANGRVRCADYCVLKRILLVLTEDGVVTIASTLTSAVTILNKWHGIEHWDWSGGQMQANIGKVCCMVLYYDVKDIQSEQEEWRSLQMQRSHKPKKIQLLHDAKNRFLVILGHCGGFVSVLNMHSGKVQFRTSAHNNQNIISMQAYPNSGYMLTAGEDKALLVWRVFPCAQQCLSLHFSVLCDLPPVLMALMGTQLTLALQDPENDTYSLVQYSLESQSRSDQQPNEKHHNKITGLSACHQLSIFASSSLDGTVRIWDMENHLLRILELNAEPECLAYCESGDLLLGITGDLYRIPRTQLLPLDCRTQKWYPESWIPVMSHECRTDSCHITKKDGLERHDRIKDPDFGVLMAIHKDLESLQKGEVECRRRKPANIKSKREAFNNYLGLIYRQPLDIRIPEEDMFDVYAILFAPKLPELPPLSPSSVTDGLSMRLPSAKSQSEPDKVQHLCNEEEEKKKNKRKEADMHLTPIVKTPSTQKSPPPPSPVPETLVYHPQKPLPPIKSPTPPLTPHSESAPTFLTSVPPSPSSAPPSPTSHLPEFLLQFMDEQWFQKMFPDQSCISSSLCPKDFCKHLLNFMMSCDVAQKNSILNALLMLIQQEVLDKELLSTGLLACLKNCIQRNMSREEQHFAGELLNVLVYLSPDGFDTIVELLAMLANEEVDLKALVLCVLQRFGVEEAELWLCPELESWNSLTKHKPNQHHSLRDMASHWLLTWTRKYKVHSGSVFLRSEGIQNVFAPVEVLKYFCSVQKGKQTRPPPPPPERRKDAVIVPSELPRLKPIQRLGETYSMSRIWEPQGSLLPPLPYRPVLMDFPRFLSLPVAHVTLSPFPFSLDFQNFKRPSPQRYFFLERSYVQYYR